MNMSATGRISVLCVDDHPLFRDGIAAAIASQEDMELIGLAATGREGVELCLAQAPDVTLMDLRLPDMSGIKALSDIRASRKDARVIILTTFEGDMEVTRALAAGARAYLLKNSTVRELSQVIRKVHEGKSHLQAELASGLAQHIANDAVTPREMEVLQLVAGGNGNRDIAVQLSITEDTVKGHVKHIMEKLSAKDRAEAVVIGLRRGILHL
jgi:DNA-binding NarL/FixJ family response regulator